MPNSFAMAPAYPAFTAGEKAMSASASSKLEKDAGEIPTSQQTVFFLWSLKELQIQVLR